MSVALEDTVYLHVGTTDPSTGGAANASSTPTVTVEEDGVAMGYSPTVTNVATGLYRITIVCSAANGFEWGKRYSVYLVATVAGVTGRDGIAEFEVGDAGAAWSVWEEILTGATHNVATSAGRKLRQIAGASFSFDGTINGTPSTTVIPLDATASTTNDFYKPGLIMIESSFGIQFARISSYAGATRQVTLATALTTTPNNGDAVTILPWASVRVSEMDTAVLNDLADAVLDELVEGSVSLRQAIRILLSVAAGAVTVTGAIRAFRDLANTKNRVQGTEDDYGQRSAVTVDGT